MKVTAKLTNLRMTPRKARRIADLVRGMEVGEAITQLGLTPMRASEPVSKLLASAVSNAENNFGLDRNNLYVSDVQVGDGMRMKRWLPKAFGRASLLLKRSSHVFLELEEIEEGKNRKSKEQLEDERKKRMEAKKQMEKDLATEHESTDKVENTRKKKTVESESKVDTKGGKWMKKMFQRKSM